MILDKIEVKDYKCLQDFSVTFPGPVTCLVGHGGSGKTSLLHSITDLYPGRICLPANPDQKRVHYFSGMALGLHIAEHRLVNPLRMDPGELLGKIREELEIYELGEFSWQKTDSPVSEGVDSLCQLYLINEIAKCGNQLILLDNPTAVTPLSEIQPWLVQLRDICENSNSQAIIATHSEEVMDYLCDSCIVLDLEQDECGKTILPPKTMVVPKEVWMPVESMRFSEVIVRGWY